MFDRKFGVNIHSECSFGSSSDKLCHPRSAAYSVELVLLNKHQISGGGAYLNCYCSF